MAIDLEPALLSLYDSLRALPSRMSETDQHRLWVARLQILIGELRQDPAALQGSEAQRADLNQLSEAISACDPADPAQTHDLLTAVEEYLTNLFPA